MGSAGHYLAARRIRAVQSGGCGEAEEQQSSGDTMYLIHVLSATYQPTELPSETDWLEPELSELSASF